jgi:hypothetical protein
MIALRDSYDRIWDRLIADAVRAGYFPADLDVRLCRLLLLGGLNWVATWYRPNGTYTPDQIADFIWTQVARSVKKPRRLRAVK